MRTARILSFDVDLPAVEGHEVPEVKATIGLYSGAGRASKYFQTDYE